MSTVSYVYLTVWVVLEIIASIIIAKRIWELCYDFVDILIILLPTIALIALFCSTDPQKSVIQLLFTSGNFIVLIPVAAFLSYTPLVIIDRIADFKQKRKVRKKQEQENAEIERQNERRKLLPDEISSFNSLYRYDIAPFLSLLDNYQCDRSPMGIDEDYHSFYVDRFTPFAQKLSTHAIELNKEANSLGLSMRAVESHTDNYTLPNI